MRDDDGSAVVEFLFVSVLLLIPIVYLVLALAQVQSAAFAAEAVARDVGRAMVVGGVAALQEGATQAAAEAAGRERAARVLDTTLADFGIATSSADVAVACSSATCLAPGSDVVTDVTISVSLPVIGSLLPGAAVTVAASAASPVDGYLP
jgi:hypothetical protein